MVRKMGALCAAMLLAVSVPAMARACAIDDAQIAHVAYTADQIDIDAGQQALDISANAGVRAFAETMVRDHTAVNK